MIQGVGFDLPRLVIPGDEPLISPRRVVVSVVEPHPKPPIVIPAAESRNPAVARNVAAGCHKMITSFSVGECHLEERSDMMIFPYSPSA